MKAAYIECFSGISGDMFLGALVDAGAPLSLMQESVDALELGVQLRVRKVNRSGISATKVDVVLNSGEPAEHAHVHEGHHSHSHNGGPTHAHAHEPGRSLPVIRALIENADIPEAVKAISIRAFELLGHAEAKIHNVPVEQIHFHEVGAVDAIADIVGTAAGCVTLGVDRWFCSALNVGGGSVECAHGTFPVPAPATLDLLAGAPVYSRGPEVELATPTGAALLRALDVQFAGFPGIRPERTGYGAGSKDFARFPNVARLTVGKMMTGGHESDRAAQITGVIETTIDDSSPQVIAYVSDLLLQEGAAEVFRTTVQMKKGRSGVLLMVLCDPERAQRLREILFRETSTIGVRYREERKYALARSFIAVETEWGAVRIKVAALATGEVVNAAAEFEECKRIAQAHHIPLTRVMQAAVEAYARQTDSAASRAGNDSRWNPGIIVRRRAGAHQRDRSDGAAAFAAV